MANLIKGALKSVDKLLNSPVDPQGIKKVLNTLNPLSKHEEVTKTIEKKSNIASQEHNGITWIDIKDTTKKDLLEFFENYPFHPLHIEACLARGQLDRVENEEKYLFVLIHSPSYQGSQTRIVAKKVCFFVGKDYVITVHENSPVVSGLYQTCQDDENERNEFFKKSSVFLAYHILNTLFKDSAEYRKEVLEKLEEIEDIVFDVKVSGVQKISKLRQEVVRLKRITSAFRRILQDLAVNQSPYTAGMTRYYKNLANEANNLWDTLDEASQTIEIYKDADITVSTEKTNKVLTLLTIVFTLTIPTTILGTFYGMNIILPGGIDSGSWNLLGPYSMFFTILGLSIISILVMLWYFKHKNWF